jgi:preprotein translocase subunit SecE
MQVMVKSAIQFVKESYEEVKKVTWPSKNDTIRLTAYVIGVSLFVGLFVTAVDYMFRELLDVFLR